MKKKSPKNSHVRVIFFDHGSRDQMVATGLDDTATKRGRHPILSRFSPIGVFRARFYKQYR